VVAESESVDVEREMRGGVYVFYETAGLGERLVAAVEQDGRLPPRGREHRHRRRARLRGLDVVRRQRVQRLDLGRQRRVDRPQGRQVLHQRRVGRQDVRVVRRLRRRDCVVGCIAACGHGRGRISRSINEDPSLAVIGRAAPRT
jgi:hypothetical protein